MSNSLITMKLQSEFYQCHLDKVSRSFALCIQNLKEPLRNRVALAYLICRILDTVEDSVWERAEDKLRQMAAFQSFILNRCSSEIILKWVAGFPSTVIQSEQALLNDGVRILSDMHNLPGSEREILQRTVLSMSRGMAYFLEKASKTNMLVLDSLAEVNRYCFFVASIVGEMLTQVVATLNPAIQLSDTLLLRSHQFGMFLQKVNLLKDQLKDEKEGRRLVPSHQEVWASLEIDMTGALAYLVEIPKAEREYRLFCGWSLFLGLGSLPTIQRSWTDQKISKISRFDSAKIFLKVTSLIDDNEALKDLFLEMKPEFKSDRIDTGGCKIKFSAGEPKSKFLEFSKLYSGDLSDYHLGELGIQ